MDYRMNNIGSRIIANSDYSNLTKPVYPFFKPSITVRQYDPPSNYFSYPLLPPHPTLPPPVYNNSYMHQTRHNLYNTLLREKVEDLEEALKEKADLRKQGTLLKMQSMTHLSSSLEYRRDNTQDEMMKVVNRQQELIGDMVKTIQTLQPRMNFPENGVEFGYRTPRPQIEKDLFEKSVDKKLPTKEDILKDLDLESDNGEEEYLDKEKLYKITPGLTELEKAQIYDRIKKQKRKREMEANKIKVKGIRKFRALVWGILFPAFVYGVMIKRKGTMKSIYMQEMRDAIEYFTKIAVNWVLKATKDPIVSVITDPSLDFNVTAKSFWFNKGKPDALNTKKLKLHVRIKGLFEGLLQATNPKSMPKPLMLFIDRFINNGAFIPQEYFVPYEKARLSFDKFGAICHQTEDRKLMLICFFLITRILVATLLMNPSKNRIPIQENSKALM